MSRPIAVDAWENCRWKVEYSEMPDSGPGTTLPLLFSQRHPVRCLWFGRKLQSNVIAHRKAFVENHSHDDFPDLPNILQGRSNVKTREQLVHFSTRKGYRSDVGLSWTSLFLTPELLDCSVDSKEKSLQIVNSLLAKWAR